MRSDVIRSAAVVLESGAFWHSLHHTEEDSL